MKLYVNSDHYWRPIVFLLAVLVLLQLLFSRQVYDVTIHSYRILQSYYLEEADWENKQAKRNVFSNFSESGTLEASNATYDGLKFSGNGTPEASNATYGLNFSTIASDRSSSISSTSATNTLSTHGTVSKSATASINDTCNPVLGTQKFASYF